MLAFASSGAKRIGVRCGEERKNIPPPLRALILRGAFLRHFPSSAIHYSRCRRLLSLPRRVLRTCTLPAKSMGDSNSTQSSPQIRAVRERKQDGLNKRHPRHNELGPGRPTPTCAQEEESHRASSACHRVQTRSPGAHGRFCSPYCNRRTAILQVQTLDIAEVIQAETLGGTTIPAWCKNRWIGAATLEALDPRIAGSTAGRY